MEGDISTEGKKIKIGTEREVREGERKREEILINKIMNRQIYRYIDRSID